VLSLLVEGIFLHFILPTVIIRYNVSFDSAIKFNGLTMHSLQDFSMYMVYVAILIPLSWLHMSFAGFTKPARWGSTNLIIQRNSAGTWCFLPVAGETTAIDCKGDHADLQTTLTAHLQQDLSIAYYNAIDNTRRGGATWSITNATELMHLCASGRGGDGIVQTICSTVRADDTFAGTPYCEVALGPRDC
jgi:hypothetical protein